MIEDIKYLEDWVNSIQQKAKELQSVSKEKKIDLLFSISTATHNPSFQKPYHSPVRYLENSFIFGVVVFSQTQAMIAANTVKIFVNGILVDIEQKINTQVGVDQQLLKHFKISVNKKIRKSIDVGNILIAIRSVIGNDKIIKYKPNDITVDAIWTFLSTKITCLSGKKIAILGCGNIGSKLALKLVESGVDVFLVRRDKLKGALIADSINIIKPERSTGSAYYTSSCIEASKLCDVLIGAANANTPVINWEMIQNMSQDGFVIDIGKGNIEADAIQKSFENNVDIIRGDVTASLYGFVSQQQQVQGIIQCKIGRKNLNSDISIVSGGVLGKNGEVVVDSFLLPCLIYGVSDGRGNMKIKPSVLDKKNIEIVKKYIERRN